MSDEFQIIPRDVRIDRVGMVDELYTLWADPMRSAIKEDLLAGCHVAAGDTHQGKIVSAAVAPVDPAKFFALFNQDRISRKDFLRCISVSKTEARKLMSEVELMRISIPAPDQVKLLISRQKGITLTLRQAINSITGATADLS